MMITFASTCVAALTAEDEIASALMFVSSDNGYGRS